MCQQILTVRTPNITATLYVWDCPPVLSCRALCFGSSIAVPSPSEGNHDPLKLMSSLRRRNPWPAGYCIAALCAGPHHAMRCKECVGSLGNMVSGRQSVNQNHMQRRQVRITVYRQGGRRAYTAYGAVIYKSSEARLWLVPPGHSVASTSTAP